jgi:hypothetical protein
MVLLYKSLHGVAPLERYCSAKAIPYLKGQRLSLLLVAAERSEAALGHSCDWWFKKQFGSGEGRAAPSADMAFPLWASGMVLPPPATDYRLPPTGFSLLTCLGLSPTIFFTALSVTALEAER